MESSNVSLSPSVIPDLIDLVKDPKFEVKKGALALILQFCTMPEHRKFFENSEIIKLLFRFITQEELETICLSNLISFSQDEWACSQIYSLKGLDRLIELLKSLNFDKNNTESYPLIIELSLLLMSNLTQNKEGVIQLLHLGEKNHEGVHFIYLFEKWINPKTSILFKFAGNVFSNVTAIKEGRESLISPEYQLISNLIGVVNSPIREIRIGALHTLRNLTFEFESECFQNQVINEKSEFIDPLMNLIARMMVFGTVDEKVKSEIKSLQLNINHMEALKDVKFDEEIIMPLELILVLTNLPEIEKRAKFQKEKLSQLLLIMKPLVKSEIKDKIDVVLCIFCQIAPDL